MINIKRNSPTHVALCYLKIRSTKLSSEHDLLALSPKKYDNRPSKALRSLELLTRLGFAIKFDNRYTINKPGIDALRQIVREQPSKENA
jgi:hypothetical protein